MIRNILCSLLFFYLCVTGLYAAEYQGHVTWVYDGDTLKVENIGKVRLLGIDTPEYKTSQRDRYYHKNFSIKAARLRQISLQAKNYNIENTKNKRVRLLTDKFERDKHDRLLAYVFLPDGSMLNRQLLKKGLATVFRRYDFHHKKEFIKLEKEARQDRLGLWAE